MANSAQRANARRTAAHRTEAHRPAAHRNDAHRGTEARTHSGPGAAAASARLALVIAAVLGLAIGPSVVGAQEGLAVGDTPEAVVLETLDGDPVDLGEVFGDRPVLIEFWATWCAVCRALEPEMRAAHEAFGDRVEVIVVAAAVAQTRDRVRQHLARHPAPGRVLWDTRGRFTRAFDAPGTGYIVILDDEGRVAYTGTGADQDLVGALKRVVGEP